MPGRNPYALLLLAVVANSASVHAETQAFLLEVGPRIGNLSGQILHQDERFYARSGLQSMGADGTTSAPDLGATVLGLEAGAYLQPRRDLSAGLAMEAQTTWTEPSQARSSNDRASLLMEESILARGSWQPWVFGPVRVGAELGAGPSFATLSRFGLAARNLLTAVDSAPEPPPTPQQVATWTHLGHQPLDMLGLRTEFAFKATGDLSPRLGVVGRFGAHWTGWSIIGSDPLPRAGYSYPSSLSGWGIDCAVDLQGRF